MAHCKGCAVDLDIKKGRAETSASQILGGALPQPEHTGACECPSKRDFVDVHRSTKCGVTGWNPTDPCGRFQIQQIMYGLDLLFAKENQKRLFWTAVKL
jgi:hypothetical protein